MMNYSLRSVNIISTTLIFLFVLIQVMLIIYVDPIPESDSLSYLKSALRVVDTGKIYPFDGDFYSRWIAAPGWVNLMALVIFITGSYKSIYFMNVLLNLGILIHLKYLAEEFIDKSAGVFVVIIFTIQCSNYGMCLNMFTELIFLFLLLSSIRLYIRGGLKNIILSGILVALANSVRQFAPVIIIVFIFAHIFYSKSYKRLFPWLLSIFLTIMVIGFCNKINSGYFVYSSVTTGANMIAGSNSLSDGSYDVIALRKGGLGYIENENEVLVFKKDSIWRSRSANWIMENPKEWLGLIPKKLFYLYSCEISTLNHFRTDPRNGSFSGDFRSLANDFPQLDSFQIVLILNNLVYLSIISLALLSIRTVFKEKFIPGYVAIFYIILQTAITVLAVGGDRYHYPMLPAFVFLAAFLLSKLSRKFVVFSA